MQRILRFWKIVYVFFYFGLDQLALSGFKHRYIQYLIRAITLGRSLHRPRGERLRLALEALGPIFVKFGQVLSTRRDLMPPDIADELAKLQDQVPPFDSAESARLVEKALGCPLNIAFQHFETHPVASASIAQVHFAVLNPTTAHPEWAGKEVAVKVLRPGMLKVIDSDLALMRDLARWVEKLWADGKRLKPREVVGEFDKYLHEELDLIREASNASQLRRNFEKSRALIVPEIYWDWCRNNVMVMEKMRGIPISRTQDLINAGINLHQLAIDGVEIFFTQVFRDGFFHADMHPGNIFVSIEPETFGRYIALDFGIIGTLSDFDKNYLAQNFLAFFNRDYHRVAALHIESGWVPKNTRVEELEGAVRSVCEPYFDRPLKDISLGIVLMRLFQVSRRFKVEIQPQLVLLQKTLLNIEGLGRQLDPELDLWKTAKPYLEKWMHRQLGLPAFWEQVKAEAPHWAKLLPQMPRLTSQLLSKRVEFAEQDQTNRLLQQLLLEQRRTHRLILMITLFVGGSLGGWLLAHIWLLVLQ